MTNAFRMTRDGSLDTVYLRTMAIYRLLKNKCIGEAQAILLADRPLRRGFRDRSLSATISIWKRGPIKDMLP